MMKMIERGYVRRGRRRSAALEKTPVWVRSSARFISNSKFIQPVRAKQIVHNNKTAISGRQQCVMSPSASPVVAIRSNRMRDIGTQSIFTGLFCCNAGRLREEFRGGGNELGGRGSSMSEINKSPAFWRSFPIFEEFDKETVAAVCSACDLPQMDGRDGDLPAWRRRQLHDCRHVRTHQAVAHHATGPGTASSPYRGRSAVRRDGHSRRSAALGRRHGDHPHRRLCHRQEGLSRLHHPYVQTPPNRSSAISAHNCAIQRTGWKRSRSTT